MEKPIVLIDCDDTITTFVSALLDKYNKKYNDNLVKDDITNWNIHKFLKPECKNIFQEFANNQLFMDCTPYEHCIDVINKLYDVCDVNFVTATFPTNVMARHEKLSSLFPKYKYDDLIIAKKKHLVHGDILIDDCYENHSDSVKHSILVNQPWNRKYELKYNMVRCSDWYEIERELESLLHIKL